MFLLRGSAQDRSLLLEFSGSQPEFCELMSEFLPLLPGRRYQLKVRYRLHLTNSVTGLQWSVQSIPSGARLMTGLMNLPAEEFVEQSFPLEIAAMGSPTRIVLSHIRQAGTTRMEGRLWIQSVQLILQP